MKNKIDIQAGILRVKNAKANRIKAEADEARTKRIKAQADRMAEDKIKRVDKILEEYANKVMP